MSSCVCGGLRVRRTCDIDFELFKKDYGIVKKKKKEVVNGILGVPYLCTVNWRKKERREPICSKHSIFY